MKSTRKHLSPPRVFLFNKLGQVVSEEKCLDAKDARSPVRMFICHPYGGNMEWSYDYKTFAIRHTKTGRCLDNLIMMKYLVLRPCNGKRGQQWLFQNEFKWQSRLHIESSKKREALRAALPSDDM